MNKFRRNQNKGITLIALVIVIIVLLILAGVSIAMLTGDNGILTQGNNAKIETAVGAVKEQLRLLQIEKRIEEKELTPETLLAEGKVSRTVQEKENDKYYMYYSLKEDSFEAMQGLGKGNLTNLKDVFLIDDELNVKYIASNGKEYGDEIKEKILEDETKIRFSSKAFSEYVSKISGVSEDELKFEWMKNQTILTITDPEVDSLQDLVFFPNLTSLKLGDKYNGENSPNITKMDGIENCIKLTELEIINGPDKNYDAIRKLKKLEKFMKYGGNDYEQIVTNLKTCEQLKKLEIRGQYTRDMSKVSELKSLEVLNLGNNLIEKIDGLENMRNLQTLWLYGNKISKIEGLEGLDNIIDINLSDNKITKIDGLEEQRNLKKLTLRNNEIIDILPLSLNKSLTFLDLRGNPKIDANRNNYTGDRLNALNEIGEILDRDGTINLDVNKLGLFTNYKKLNLSNSNLTTLDVLNGMTELTQLTLTDNLLTLEDEKSQEILSRMSNLLYLDIGKNELTNISSINNLRSLQSLYLNGNNKIDLKQIEDIISNLNVLRVSTESLNTILNCNINKITTLNIPASSLKEIPDLSKLTKLSKLNLDSNSNISNFDIISKVTSLTNLIISNNNLHGRMIDFSKLTNLSNIDLRNNTLWSEDLENLKALKNNTKMTINLSNNSIIDATALLELNPNTKINLKGNVNLSQDSKDKLKARFGNNVTF